MMSTSSNSKISNTIVTDITNNTNKSEDSYGVTNATRTMMYGFPEDFIVRVYFLNNKQAASESSSAYTQFISALNTKATSLLYLEYYERGTNNIVGQIWTDTFVVNAQGGYIDYKFTAIDSEKDVAYNIMCNVPQFDVTSYVQQKIIKNAADKMLANSKTQSDQVLSLLE